MSHEAPKSACGLNHGRRTRAVSWPQPALFQANRLFKAEDAVFKIEHQDWTVSPSAGKLLFGGRVDRAQEVVICAPMAHGKWLTASTRSCPSWLITWARVSTIRSRTQSNLCAAGLASHLDKEPYARSGHMSNTYILSNDMHRCYKYWYVKQVTISFIGAGRTI